MNRQMRRANKQKSPAKILVFGVFYKGDTDGGCGQAVSVMNGMDQHFVDAVYKGALDMTAATLKDTRHLTNDELVAETEGWVAEFNRTLFGTNGEQPARGIYPSAACDTHTMATVFIMVASYLAALRRRGLLVDDSQNGWLVVRG